MVAVDRSSRMESLYRGHHARLVRLAYFLTGSWAVAEELAQEAFVRLWPHLDRADDPGAYLTRVLTNLSSGHRRRLATERRHAPVPPGPSLPPEVDETWQQLWLLPDRQRSALVLRFYADLDVAGVADALGCPLGTAKSLIHRGVARLGEVLET